MALIRWEDRFLVGQAQVDEEHRYLFQLINDFHDAFVEDHDRARVLLLLNCLVEYAERHFANEEALMQMSGYPGIDAHRAHHEQLFEQIFQLNARFQDRAVNPTHATVQFLRNWLTDHILHEDLLFGAHLKKLAQ
jgi:hemerythrin